VLVKGAGGPHKLKFYAKLLCGLVLSAVGGASFTTAQAQVNWRQTDSVNLGKTIARVEISSSRQIRITAVNDAVAELHSPDMNPVMLKIWAQLTHDELPTPTRVSYEFENTLQLQPAVKGSDSAGYMVTIADSVGQTRAAFATLSQTDALVVALVNAAQRLPILSDAELRQSGTLPPEPVVSNCDRIRDSVLTKVPADRWPVAHAVNRARPPKAPFDAVAGVPVTASITVLPDGSVDPSSLKVTGSADGQYEIKVLEWLSKETKWTAGTVAGCAVVSRAGLSVVRIGIPRSR
jgi:hypothetical protein